jgi:hypothetical protein
MVWAQVLAEDRGRIVLPGRIAGGDLRGEGFGRAPHRGGPRLSLGKAPGGEPSAHRAPVEPEFVRDGQARAALGAEGDHGFVPREAAGPALGCLLLGARRAGPICREPRVAALAGCGDRERGRRCHRGHCRANGRGMALAHAIERGGKYNARVRS